MTNGTTPLIALDAAVIDTETTGLDPRKARIVELAALRMTGGRFDDVSFSHLIDPGEPIPAAATHIHGIDNTRVAGAPAFAAAWPEFSALLGNAVLIGHTIGFDLAVLKRECERAGLAWRQPQTLDTRLLAEIAEPALADYSLESLASWLGVEISNRHSALGDARAAAHVFHALLPKLRDKNIRTLAEAARACRSLTSVLDQQHRAGWTEAVPANDDAAAGGAGAHRQLSVPPCVGQIMASARFITTHAPIADALTEMTQSRISSLFVGQPGGAPADTGIITERDIMRALAADGGAALTRPVEQAMSKPLAAVPADAFAYLAVSRMNRLKVRHLGVTDESGKVVGALSARDLLRLRAEGGVQLGDTIDQAKDVHELALAWGHVARVAAELRREGLSGREVAAVISRELGAMTHRAAVIAEGRVLDGGHGTPPCPYALVVLGSGRPRRKPARDGSGQRDRVRSGRTGRS